MQPLPHEFLKEMARQYQLSKEQEEAFIAVWGSKNTQQQVAAILGISHNALRTRLTGVYRKFSFNQKGPNKYLLLYSWLCKEYRKRQSRIAEEKVENIQAMVKRLRQQSYPFIQQRCGKMQVLDMTQAIDLDSIYTDVNILEKITARQRFSLVDLQKVCQLRAKDFERLGFGKVREKRVAGLKAVNKHPKLMVWGKPGAGKTTFLKYLAMQCLVGKWQAQLVPLFITLKEFAEKEGKPDLFTYVAQQYNSILAELGNRKQRIKSTKKYLHQVIENGKTLILLDGLDEVREEDSHRIIDQIQGFTRRYYGNRFVITCRIAAREYTFQGFTEVEVADFNTEQIKSFSSKWFQYSDPIKAKRFMGKLLRNKPIQELATNPLLLTLLCLVFGETGDFPPNHSELYEEGTDILLKKWDAKRNIERDQVYRKLSIRRKEDLLSQVAYRSFEDKEYFLKKRKLAKYISDYIRNLPDAQTDPEVLLVDGEAVLESIEAQHGLVVARAKNIYSFSHLTFQEYFTARYFARHSSRKELVNLACHITETRWREVFLLMAEMLDYAEDLVRLMSQEIGKILGYDEKLQRFLCWLKEKAASVENDYTEAEKIRVSRKMGFAFHLPATLLRYLYFAFAKPSVSTSDLASLHALASNVTSTIDSTLTLVLARTLAIESTFTSNYPLNEASSFVFINAHALARILDKAIVLTKNIDSGLYEQLLLFKEQIPDIENKELLKEKWQFEGNIWTKQLRKVMIQYRNIGHDWQFNEEQQKLLRQYQEASELLEKCLYKGYVSPEVRQEIEAGMFLPTTE